MKKFALAAGAGALSPLGLVLAVALTAGGTSIVSPVAAAAAACQSGSAPTGTDLRSDQTLTAEQLGNAQIIYQVSANMKLPSWAAVVAIATAMQESSLINLTTATNYDSLGLFQQRPSQGWGSAAQVTDPVYASQAFYSRLIKVPNWQSIPLTQAAQAVQRSAYPDAYAQWQSQAQQLVGTFDGAASNCSGSTSDGDGQTTTSPVQLPVGFSLPAGTPVQVVTAIKYALAQLGKPYLWGGTGPNGYDCSGLVMEAYLAAGIALPRTTYQQVNVGTPVYAASQLQPGDLIFTAGSDGTAANPGHVGIYLGGDLVEDAPHTGADIELSKFDGGYWNKNAVAMRRVVD